VSYVVNVCVYVGNRTHSLKTASMLKHLHTHSMVRPGTLMEQVGSLSAGLLNIFFACRVIYITGPEPGYEGIY
jgi:hypothetical protein